MNKTVWIILCVIFLLAYIFASGGNSSSKPDEGKTLVSGICSHCHGSGLTSYGTECRWCDGYGYWGYYK